MGLMRTREQHVIVGFGLMSPNLNNLTIIVVEDDNDVRRHVGAFLGRSGAKVVVARNGTEGLEAIKNNHPNMVLSDIKMPELDGFGLMREIRALGLDAGDSVPVVAMTACLIQGNARPYSMLCLMAKTEKRLRQLCPSENVFKLDVRFLSLVHPKVAVWALFLTLVILQDVNAVFSTR
jgi:CheY-like chemotaxis protein